MVFIDFFVSPVAHSLSLCQIKIPVLPLLSGNFFSGSVALPDCKENRQATFTKGAQNQQQAL
jgi:hypothetical protein